MDHTMNAPASSRPAPRPSRFRSAASCLAVVTLLTTSVPMAAQARSAPESFADLAEEVTGAVVNISASTTVEARNRTLPQLPPGTPFEDLFEEFFNRRGQGNGNGGGRKRSAAPAALEFARIGLRHRSLGYRCHQQSRDRRRERHQRDLPGRHPPESGDHRQGFQGRSRGPQGEERQAAESREIRRIPTGCVPAIG